MDGHGLGPEDARAFDAVLSGLRWDMSLSEALTRAVETLTPRVSVVEALALRFDGRGKVAEAARLRGGGHSAEPVRADGGPAPAAWTARLASAGGAGVPEAWLSGVESDPARVLPLFAFSGATDGPDQSDAPDVSAASRVLALPMRRPEGPVGLLALRSAVPIADWPAGVGVFARLLASGLALFCAGRTYGEERTRQGDVLDTALNQLRAFVYVSDPRTDEILYMNRAMRDAFGLDRPEGRTCWKVLQHDRSGRCDFCPVPYLEEHAAERPVYRWEEHNRVTGRVYENYDSLMPWMDGRLVHFQQSLDVTDSRRLVDEASHDELTGLLNRRAGKAALEAALHDEDDAPLTVGLLDVDFLKTINDEYGHAEGDRALRLVARCLSDETREPDFCFRLSGDEFVCVFRHCTRRAAVERLERLRERAGERGRAFRLPCRVDFCFGVFEVEQGDGRGLDEVLACADAGMYEQKKQSHIREAERLLAAKGGGGPAADPFPGDARLLYRALADSTESYVYVSDMKSGAFRYSPAMVAEFGLPGEVVDNAAAVWGEHIHPDDKAAFLEANQIVLDGRADVHCVEYRARNRRGEWVRVRCRGRVERDELGRPALFAGFITNLGQRNKVDPVTGLFNKLRLAEDIDALPPSRSAHLLLMGLDGFRNVNDLYGRSFGDEVLRQAAQRMLAALPAGAALYRLDGDEFGALFQGGREEIAAVYRALAEGFRHQREYEGKKYFCTLSAGAAGYPDDARDYEGLMRSAGSALEASKRSGKNRLTFFRRELVENQRRSLELTELLRECIERDYEGFELYYQPQVTADGGLKGAEALARWTCPGYGAVSPGEFIPLLEQSGLIVPFGRWVFRQAARQCKLWAEKWPRLTVGVNLSYLQATSDDMLPFIRSTLDKLKLDPARLMVEFTESCVIQGDQAVRALFDGLRGLGIRIAMDDFGTGYSSLGMLKTLPVDLVKIDRAFVRDILHSKFDETFIRFIVELCHHVGIEVCLEGVERDEEMRLVKPLCVDYIQGYLFGRPMNVETFDRLAPEPLPRG